MDATSSCSFEVPSSTTPGLPEEGGGAVDLAMHLHNLDFKDASTLLRSLGV
ncbi:hypothetical protein RSSE_c3010 [Ralstonia solanacearum]|nr:hypothetical protein RSSE_c3010 [Ralstonia solanacearum]